MSRSVDVRLDIVGEDTMGGAIQDLVRRLGLESRVSFHGFNQPAALASFYQRAHLFVLSSRHEAANVAVLEAAASGVPIAGTAVWVTLLIGHERRTAEGADGGSRRSVIAGQCDRARACGSRSAAGMAAAARAWSLAHDADWTTLQFEQLYQRLTE